MQLYANLSRASFCLRAELHVISSLNGHETDSNGIQQVASLLSVFSITAKRLTGQLKVKAHLFASSPSSYLIFPLFDHR